MAKEVPIQGDFVESQKAALCGQHALNNVYGRAKFITRSDLSGTLFLKNEKATEEHTDDAQINLAYLCAKTSDGCRGNEWFSSEVIQKAIETSGFVRLSNTIKPDENESKTKLIDALQKQYADEAYVGSLINLGALNTKNGTGGVHWVGLKKGSQTCPTAALYIDSQDSENGVCIPTDQFAVFFNKKPVNEFIHIFRKNPLAGNVYYKEFNAENAFIIKSRMYDELRKLYKAYKTANDSTSLKVFQTKVQEITGDEAILAHIRNYNPDTNIENEMIEYINTLVEFYKNPSSVYTKLQTYLTSYYDSEDPQKSEALDAFQTLVEKNRTNQKFVEWVEQYKTYNYIMEYIHTLLEWYKSPTNTKVGPRTLDDREKGDLTKEYPSIQGIATAMMAFSKLKKRSRTRSRASSQNSKQAEPQPEVQAASAEADSATTTELPTAPTPSQNSKHAEPQPDVQAESVESDPGSLQDSATTRTNEENPTALTSSAPTVSTSSTTTATTKSSLASKASSGISKMAQGIQGLFQRKPETEDAKKAAKVKEIKEAKDETEKKPLFTTVEVAGTSLSFPTSYEDEERRTRVFSELQKAYAALLKETKEQEENEKNEENEKEGKQGQQGGATVQSLLAELKPAEKQVLAMFGMDDAFVAQHAEHMAEFLNSFPNCTTDTSLMLNRRCERAYFLMLSLVYRRQQLPAKQTTQAMSPLQQAMNTSLVRGLGALHADNKLTEPEESVGSPGTPAENIEELTALFFTLLSPADKAFYQIASLE